DLIDRARLEAPVVPPQFAERHAAKILARRQSLADDPANDLVRLTKWHPALREVISEICRREHAALGGASHGIAVETQATHDERENRQRIGQRGRVIGRNRLLLKIRGLRHWQT